MTLREKCPTPLLTRFDAAFVGQEEVTRSQAKDLLAAAALASPRALLSGAGAGDHLKKIFNHLDLDESGALDASELLARRPGHARRPLRLRHSGPPHTVP